MHLIIKFLCDSTFASIILKIIFFWKVRLICCIRHTSVVGASLWPWWAWSLDRSILGLRLDLRYEDNILLMVNICYNVTSQPGGWSRDNRHVSLSEPCFLRALPKNLQDIPQYQNPFEKQIPENLHKHMVIKDNLTPEHLSKVR